MSVIGWHRDIGQAEAGAKVPRGVELEGAGHGWPRGKGCSGSRHTNGRQPWRTAPLPGRRGVDGKEKGSPAQVETTPLPPADPASGKAA